MHPQLQLQHPRLPSTVQLQAPQQPTAPQRLLLLPQAATPQQPQPTPPQRARAQTAPHLPHQSARHPPATHHHPTVHPTAHHPAGLQAEAPQVSATSCYQSPHPHVWHDLQDLLKNSQDAVKHVMRVCISIVMAYRAAGLPRCLACSGYSGWSPSGWSPSPSWSSRNGGAPHRGMRAFGTATCVHIQKRQKISSLSGPQTCYLGVVTHPGAPLLCA